MDLFSLIIRCILFLPVELYGGEAINTNPLCLMSISENQTFDLVRFCANLGTHPYVDFSKKLLPFSFM